LSAKNYKYGENVLVPEPRPCEKFHVLTSVGNWGEEMAEMSAKQKAVATVQKLAALMAASTDGKMAALMAAETAYMSAGSKVFS
jgi:hypothetical protein